MVAAQASLWERCGFVSGGFRAGRWDVIPASFKRREIVEAEVSGADRSIIQRKVTYQSLVVGRTVSLVDFAGCASREHDPLSR